MSDGLVARDERGNGLANADEMARDGARSGDVSGTSSAEWPALRVGELPEGRAFPLELLPETAARLAREGAVALGCDPGLIAGPTLALAAGLIGKSVRLEG